jgi:competence protein CoiA
MLSAYDATGRQVIARDVTKAEGPFACPDCQGEVILKKGVEKVHHFAHVPPFTCNFGVGESEEHLTAKLQVYNALLPAPEVRLLMVERVIKRPSYKVRLDVSCRVKNRYFLTIELQFSTESPDELSERTEHYTASDIYVLWLLPFPKNLSEGEIYATKQMERYMHALYYGTVYYWMGGDLVLPVHYHKYSLGSVYREWFDNDKEEWKEGFIEQYPKNHSRIPEFHQVVRITDLKPCPRKAGQFGSYALPAARLWGLDKRWYSSSDVE